MKKILIIEDDELIAALERDYLLASNYNVAIETDGMRGFERCKEESFDLILLDVMLPHMDGFLICKKIREESDVPIILVTAKKEDIDKIRGLGMGADDYVIKPFSPSELIARIKAHIDRQERLIKRIKKEFLTDTKEEDVIIKRDLHIDRLSHRVWIRGEEITMANKEYEILNFMAENPDIVFSKEQIYDKIWGMDNLGDTATVTVHINRIRDKLEKDPTNPEYIETVWGAGYRFCAK